MPFHQQHKTSNIYRACCLNCSVKVWSWTLCKDLRWSGDYIYALLQGMPCSCFVVPLLTIPCLCEVHVAFMVMLQWSACAKNGF